MSYLDETLITLEARLIAQRRILARLVAEMPPERREALLAWIAEREVMHDGQEDPGAVPDATDTLPLSIADEFRRIAALARRHRRNAA
ncbi:hypothetical protein AXZ77_1640 [Thioclava sp. ES.031]|uniref:hypothetical protein n=1 Tax=Thioclava sp. ES.031 TaxID=1798203 RepID=UPI000BF903C9|nr:hypothetical protein [Thioclava sp. ES.031]PFG63049.1 hypothetical protein AXZ77_1640 [Thioclava sp. ES.031]